MNRLDHLLVIFAEECSEVAQETAKALRFGIYEQRDLPTTNIERMGVELSQLLAMAEMLKDEGYEIPIYADVMDAKKEKVEKYLAYSKHLGRLTEDPEKRS